MEILRQVPSRSRHPGASIRALFGPMLNINRAPSLALPCDRIVLGHVSTDISFVSYTVAVQIFAPVIALAAATAQRLWLIYVEARTRGQHGPGLRKVVMAVVLATASVCSILILVADQLFQLPRTVTGPADFCRSRSAYAGYGSPARDVHDGPDGGHSDAYGSCVAGECRPVESCSPSAWGRLVYCWPRSSSAWWCKSLRLGSTSAGVCPLADPQVALAEDRRSAVADSSC